MSRKPIPAPDPPSGFRGEWSLAPEALRPLAAASGILTGEPLALAVPREPDDVSTLVRWAASEEVPLIPRAAGTGMPGGNLGRGVVVDMVTHFRGIGRIDRGAGRVVVQPGVTLGALNRAAAPEGLRFPVDPSSGERCTLGGMTANNAGGARTVRYGSTGRWVEAMRLVSDEGEAAVMRRGERTPEGSLAARLSLLRDDLGPERERIEAAWPAVRKNSSGYALREFLAGDDLDLFVGSEGTLGFITELELRLTALPAATGLALIELPSLDAVPEAVRRLLPLEPATCEMLDATFLRLVESAGASPFELAEGVEAVLLVDVEGAGPDAVQARLKVVERELSPIALRVHLAAAPEERSRMWRLRTAASPIIAAHAGGRRSMQFIEDSVVPVPALPDYIRALREVLDRHGLPAVIFGHAGDGNLHVNPLVDPTLTGWRDTIAAVLDEIATTVAELGGTLAGEHGDGRMRAPLLERIWGPEMATRFRRVKQVLDPVGILNPGTVVPLPGQTPFDLLR